MFMNRYQLIGLMLIGALHLEAKQEGTKAARFDLQKTEMQGVFTKTFVNNTGRDLVIRWRLTEPKSRQYYGQEPIVKKGEELVVDFQKAWNYFQSLDVDAKVHEFTLELLRVDKTPKKHGEELKTSRLKEGEYASLLNKNKFYKYRRFELSRNKNGLLVCQGTSLVAS